MHGAMPCVRLQGDEPSGVEGQLSAELAELGGSQDRTRSGLALKRLESLLPGGLVRVKGGFAVAPRWRRRRHP